MLPAGAGTRSLEIAIRTGVIDCLALPEIRPSGKRELGRMTPFDEEELKAIRSSCGKGVLLRAWGEAPSPHEL
jgi:hypothetical protein